MSDLAPGDWILAQWQGDRLWFPGVVHSIGEDGTVAIRYDDGTSEIRPANQVKRYDWQAGSRIQAVWSGNGRWYDATITQIEPDGSNLTVEFDDGIVERTVTGRCRSE
ncbi:MAG: tudor domain-containing protein [Allosphingosinicella sp.]